MNKALLSVQGLSVAYATGRVLAGVSFDARGGSIVGVVGPNGAGKSTLLKALLGMVSVDGGRITVDGAAPGSDAFAYMPQRSEIDWDYPALAQQVVEMGGWRPAGFGGLRLRRPADLPERAAQALRQLGMAQLARRQIGELSGGQRQRVLLARTLVRGDAPVLLLDEPFAAVDAATEAVLWDVLTQEATRGRLVIVVHHELASAARFDEVLLLGARRSAFGPAAQMLCDEMLAQAYGASTPCLELQMFDELFIAPLRDYAFMRHGLAVVALVGATSAVLSCLLVVRRQALLGDAIAHSVLLGVVLGWLVAQEAGVCWGALAAGVASGLLITTIERTSRIKFDAATGIVFTFLFALALAILSVVKPRGVDLFHVLLGNVLGVGPEELWLTAVSCGAVLAVVLLLFRPLQLWSFDPVLAQAQGLSTGLVHYLFTTLLSVTIVASIQAVGLVLVIAMLVTPGATAYLLSNRLAAMMAIAATIGLACGTGGLYASYHLDVASGPAMVIAVGLCFFAALLLAPQRGLLRRAWAQGQRRRRARADDALRAIATAQAEDDAALSAAELAQRLRCPPRQLRRTLGELARHGLIESAAAPRLRTTAAGADKARDLVRAHRLLERWLHDVEQLPIDQLHRAADRLEHEVDADALRRMAQQLGSPRSDPHGHAIPAEHEALRRIAARPLAELGDGQAARVSMVRDDSDDALRAIARLGFLPDARVTMLAHEAQGLRVAIDGREATVIPALAERVFVMPRPVAV